MKRFMLHFLHFSRRERLGAIALMLLCGFVFILPEIMSRFYPQQTTDFSQFQKEIKVFRNAMMAPDTPAGELFAFDPNTASVEDFMQLGLSEKVAGIICNYREKGGKFRQPEDFQKIWSLPKADYERLLPYIQIESPENRELKTKQVARQFELFAFDPNTATESEFLRLGLPQWTVKSILNYRTKGGFFRKKEDFRKIYTLEEEDYARLEPYIVFGQTTVATETLTPTINARSTSAKDSPKFSTRGPLDINRAGADDWRRLPGIGEKRAAQIVHFRSSLGGFLSVDQVGEMYGLPDSIFQKIRPMLVLNDNALRKINLNTAPAWDLNKHPYISGKQAKLIVAYREQHGAFASVDDLTKIAALTDKIWLEKVRPYLDVR